MHTPRTDHLLRFDHTAAAAMATTPSSPPSATTMRAVQYDGYGGGAEGLKHVEVPIPVPKKGEVLIKMEAASINPIDWKIQSGILRPFLPWKFPSIPACDLAGEVAAVGGGVSGFELGDKVIAINFPSGGGFAEYAVAQASLTVARPPEVSAAEGACLPLAAVTALQALRAAGAGLDDAPPKNVLVTAASGGVGHFAKRLTSIHDTNHININIATQTTKNTSFSISSLSLFAMAAAADAAPKTMRAVQYDKYGGGAEGLKHVEVPIPSPKEGEVLIKMEAASINPIDWKIQKGMLRLFLPKKFPFIPDKVISMSFPNCGGLAEYAVAPASLTVARPPEVSAAEGASLPAAAGSALQQLKAAGNVLVTAASGGVGHYAVQLAKLAGLHVTATCGARNLAFVRDGLGADEALDYRTPDGAALRSPSGRRYDAVAHCAPPAPWPVFRDALADAGGVVVDLTPGVAATVRSFLHRVTFSKKRLVPLILIPKEEEMEWLVDMAKQGKLKTTIDSKYPLSRAQEAWAKSMEGHATGKIVVEMGGTE
uniref:Enoyl reductase (ER) domain-containing protein n=1 Tax=Oryza meridionalis TaxID=40149 RepID=A0A0E0E8N1_9ORYZ